MLAELLSNILHMMMMMMMVIIIIIIIIIIIMKNNNCISSRAFLEKPVVASRSRNAPLLFIPVYSQKNLSVIHFN